MKNHYKTIKHLLLLLLLATGLLQSKAQNIRLTPTVVPGMGHNIKLGNLNISGTVGQPANATIKNSNVVLTQGFGQPERPLPPVAPAEERVCNDTGIHQFIFTNVLPGLGGNQVEWSLNSNFDTSQIITVSDTIKVSVSHGDIDTLWLRSVFSNTLLVSEIVYTIAINGVTPGLPNPPAPISICSDTGVIFTFDSLAGEGADQLLWGSKLNFLYGDTLSADSSIKVVINTGEQDTIWFKSRISSSGCVSSNAYTTLKVNLKPDPPRAPAPQSIASDTAIIFTFANIDAGLGANRLVWALDSNFTYAHIDTPGCDINVMVQPDTFSLIWLKSEDTISECVSRLAATILIVQSGQVMQPRLDTLPTICRGTTTKIPIENTVSNRTYYLELNNVAIDSITGNDSLVELITGVIDSNTRFNILVKDSAGSILALDTTHVVIVALAVDTPEFIAPDTLLLSGDTASYFAIADYSIRLIYNIASGGATIDSITGAITNATSNFIVRAVATGLPGCGVKSKDIKITVTNIGPPVFRELTEVEIDSPNAIKSIILDSILAGDGADKIEWATNKNFIESHLVTSPATIEFNLQAGVDTMIWIRSVDSKTNKHGQHKSAIIGWWSSDFCAALLDKSDWELDWHDEFLYNNGQLSLPSQIGPSLTDKWAFNLANQSMTDGTTPANCGGRWCPESIENHVDWKVDTRQIYNLGNTPGLGNGIEGSAGEVSFKNGTAVLKASSIPWRVVGSPYFPPKLIDFKSGMLCSKLEWNHAEPGLFELRCRMPASNWSWPAFWTFGGTIELDFLDQIDNRSFKQHMGVVDWNRDEHGNRVNDGKCGTDIIKTWGSCNFMNDWYTLSCRYSEQDIKFFINSKEVYSVTRIPGEEFPSWVNWPVPVMISLGVKHNAQIGSDEFNIDYIRHYRAKPTVGIGFNCLQYSDNGYAQSIRSIKGRSFPQPVYRELYVRNTPDNRPQQLFPLDCYMNAVGTGNNLELFFVGGGRPGNQMCYTAYGISGSFWYIDNITPRASGNLFVADINNCLVAASNKLLYYQSSRHQLKYFLKQGGLWSVGTACRNNNPITPINNCAGSITVDNLGRVWYRSYDNNLWVWSVSDGVLSRVTSDGSVRGNVLVHKCGCMVFYRDVYNNMRQLSWWNTWLNKGVVVNNGLVTNEMVLDEDNSRVYFIGTDHNIYYYNYDFNNLNPNGLFKLGNHALLPGENNNNRLCTADDNAASFLSLSYDKNMVFYRGVEGALWYYYNDHENSVDPVNPNMMISKENWYKTLLSGGSGTQEGKVVQEPTKYGKIFFPTWDSRIKFRDWSRADWDKICPETSSYIYKTEGVDSAKDVVVDSKVEENKREDAGEAQYLSIFPNPSSGTFTVRLTNFEHSADFEIRIEDMQGRVVYSAARTTPSSGETLSLLWDANETNTGIYLCHVKVGNKIFKDKMVKF